MGGPWERWTVPIIPWALLTHLSPAAAQVAGITPGAGAVGQVLAFRRGAYARLGGHGAVRAAVAEDVALARLATRHRLRWRLAAGWRVSRCRMYPSRREAFAGLEKNLFPALGGRTVPFLLAWAWLLRAFAAPPLLAALRLTRGEFRQAAAPAGAAGMGFVSWLLVARALGLPRRTVLEGPVIVTVGSALAVRSWLAWKTGQATWKGRRLGAGGS
jgi:chlorobactene glucosyltransferase